MLKIKMEEKQDQIPWEDSSCLEDVVGRRVHAVVVSWREVDCCLVELPIKKFKNK
jgi:hypothetical protein